MNLVDELHAVTGALRSAGVRHAVCVISRTGLLNMKRLAGREQDLADLAALELTRVLRAAPKR